MTVEPSTRTEYYTPSASTSSLMHEAPQEFYSAPTPPKILFKRTLISGILALVSIYFLRNIILSVIILQIAFLPWTIIFLVWGIMISSSSYRDEFFGLELIFLWGGFLYCTIKLVAVLFGLIGSLKSLRPLLFVVSMKIFLLFVI